MDIFLLLVSNLAPLYILIAFGFIGGRWLEVNLHSMAIVTIYFITPVVTFGAISKLSFESSYLLLPVMLFCCAAIIAFFSYNIAKLIWKDNTPNLVGMSLGGGNTGYFGLPVILALFDVQGAAIYLLAIFAITLNENTLCYYIGARGNSSVKESLLKVLKLPVFYAIWLGLAFSIFDIKMPDVFYVYWERFTGAWIVIGMMLIGIALAKVETFRLNLPLLSFMFAVKFIVWPLAMLAIIALDHFVLGLFNKDIYVMLTVIGTVPIIANSVAFAAQLNVRPGEAATAVLLSTVFALFYLPLVLALVLD